MPWAIRFFIVLTFKPFGCSAFTAWCNLREFGCGKTPNSMCIYDEDPFKNQCIGMVDRIATESWVRIYWLALMNSFRDRVAAGRFEPWPEGANMNQLVWDDTLEAQARRWNFQCLLQRSDECNRNSNYNRTQIGQIQSHVRNVKRDTLRDQAREMFESIVNHENTMSESHIQKLVDNRIPEDTYRNGGPDFLLACLLFATLENVGASLIVSGWVHKNTSNILRSNSYFAPMSLDVPVYKRGTPCSECPSGWSCRSDAAYPNLCALPSYPRQGQYIDVEFSHARGPFEGSFAMPALVSMMLVTGAKLD